MKNKMKMNRIILALLVLPLFFGCGDNNETPIENTGHILDLPPMKDHFASKFMIGNIFNPGIPPNPYVPERPSDFAEGKISNEYLTRHFNVLTCENNMKPYALAPTKGNYTFETADDMVNSAITSGFKVVGHTLLWHSQNASWMTSSVTENDMTDYITAVVEHFKGRIHSWDVLNEVFPDGVSASANWKNVMRTENPWYASTMKSDFVYKGFLAARNADPDAILYYNDYNTDNVGKATMIRNMVRDVNEEYKKNFPNETRLLIEGIGMQEHHNLWVQASAIRATLNLFKPLGVKISVSELDVLSQTWSDYDSETSVTNAGRADQAKKYGEYMAVYLDFQDIIERVSLWGVTDDKSWRARGEPLLFDRNGMAKPAYYSFVGALNN